MDVLRALELLRDKSVSQDAFVFAVEYLNLYREGNVVVHYCPILSEYVYIGLSGLDLFYLDFIGV